MRFGQRIYAWVRASRLALLLLGVLLGSVLGIVAYHQIIKLRIVRPLYGVVRPESMPDTVCITADRPFPESNGGDDRTLCADIPRDPLTGQAIELPPNGSRVEAGVAWVPLDSWSGRTVQLVYLIPEETMAERVNWFLAPQCHLRPCYTDTPEEAARLMVLSIRYGALTRAEVEQSFQVQGTQPIGHGMIVFYTRANYRAAVRQEQRSCGRLVLRAGDRWIAPLTSEHCVPWPQPGPLQVSVEPDDIEETAFWGVYGHVTDPMLQQVEVLSAAGNTIRGPIRNGHFFVMVPERTSPRELRVFDSTNQTVVRCDSLRNWACS
jgi:hypothetical protein